MNNLKNKYAENSSASNSGMSLRLLISIVTIFGLVSTQAFAQISDYKLTFFSMKSETPSDNSGGISFKVRQYKDSSEVSPTEINNWFKLSLLNDFNSLKNPSDVLREEEYSIKSFALGMNINNMYKETINIGSYFDSNSMYLLKNNYGAKLLIISDILLVNNKTGAGIKSDKTFKILINPDMLNPD